MRSTTGLFLVAATLMATGCDRQSGPGEQYDAAANNVGAAIVANEAAADMVSPDEVTAPSGGAVAVGAFDRSHKGEAAPAYGFTDPDGKPATLAASRGKPTLLNLWATWCAPCVKEMPTLDALAARTKGSLNVIALSQDLDPAKVAPFWSKGAYTTLRPSTDPKLAFSTGMGANLPTTILYDSAGKEVWRLTGSIDWSGPEAAKAIAEAR